MASLWKFIVLLCLAAVALAIGCRTPQIVTQLERENYALESKIWELVSQLEQKQAELDACRSELERLKSRAGATSQKANPSSHPRELYAPTWPEGGDMLAPAPSVGSSTEPFALPEVSVTPPAARHPRNVPCQAALHIVHQSHHPRKNRHPRKTA